MPLFYNIFKKNQALYQKTSMLKRRHTGSLCYGEGRRQELLQKICSFRALGELQLAFYLYQHVKKGGQKKGIRSLFKRKIGGQQKKVLDPLYSFIPVF